MYPPRYGYAEVGRGTRGHGDNGRIHRCRRGESDEIRLRGETQVRRMKNRVYGVDVLAIEALNRRIRDAPPRAMSSGDS